MATAYEEILNILSDVEQKNNMPPGTLRKIYDAENTYVHLRNREDLHSRLRGIVSDAAMEVD